MEITVQEIIDRARMYAQDDFNDNKGAILKPARWLQLFNSLNRRLTKQWTRSSLISPPPVDREFTGPLVRLKNVAAIQGVIRCTVKGFSNLVVDLADYLEGAPHKLYRIKDYLGSTRPTFTVVPNGLALTLTMVGNAITLTINSGVTTVADVTAAVFASSFMELVSIPDDNDATVLDNLKPGYWSFDPSVFGGEVLVQEWSHVRSSHHKNKYKTPFRADIDATASTWTGTGYGGEVQIKLYPADHSSQTYVVRYVEEPAAVTDSDGTVTIPSVADDYFSLKLAEMALMTEQGASRVMQKTIIDQEAALGFAAADLQPPRMKPARSTPELGVNGYPLYPTDWLWL